MNQQGRNIKELQEEWRISLENGCRKINVTLPSDTKFIFPFYGDILHELAKDVDNSTGKLVEKGNASDEEMYFIRDLLNEVVENAGITTEQIRENYSEELSEKGVLNWAWVIAMARTVDRIPVLREIILNIGTNDVFKYLSIPHIRTEIDKLVVGHFEDDPCVIVAHSLGTVIAYNVLREKIKLNVDTLITLGSPLGIRTIKKYLDKPLLMPSCISNLWFNALDGNDIVPLNPLTTRHFPITPEITNKTDLVNETPNRHEIGGYLSDPEVAAIIYQRLTELNNSIK